MKYLLAFICLLAPLADSRQLTLTPGQRLRDTTKSTKDATKGSLKSPPLQFQTVDHLFNFFEIPSMHDLKEKHGPLAGRFELQEVLGGGKGFLEKMNSFLETEAPVNTPIDIATRFDASMTKLGAGGFGTVFRAKDLTTNENVAVKILGLKQESFKTKYDHAKIAKLDDKADWFAGLMDPQKLGRFFSDVSHEVLMNLKLYEAPGNEANAAKYTVPVKGFIIETKQTVADPARVECVKYPKEHFKALVKPDTNHKLVYVERAKFVFNDCALAVRGVVMPICAPQPDPQYMIFNDVWTAEKKKVWAKQIIEAFKYIHDVGISHNDIKFENQLICGGRVKVMDFGLASVGVDYEGVRGTAAWQPPELSLSFLGRGTGLFEYGDNYKIGMMFAMVFGRVQMKEFSKEYYKAKKQDPDEIVSGNKRKCELYRTFKLLSATATDSDDMKKLKSIAYALTRCEVPRLTLPYALELLENTKTCPSPQRVFNVQKRKTGGLHGQRDARVTVTDNNIMIQKDDPLIGKNCKKDNLWTETCAAYVPTKPIFRRGCQGDLGTVASLCNLFPQVEDSVISDWFYKPAEGHVCTSVIDWNKDLTRFLCFPNAVELAAFRDDVQRRQPCAEYNSLPIVANIPTIPKKYLYEQPDAPAMTTINEQNAHAGLVEADA